MSNETTPGGCKHNMLTIFLDASNVHLSKDVCQIPYHMHKTYGFHSAILYRGEADVSLYSEIVPGLKFINLRNLFNKTHINIDIFIYLLKNAKNIDFLNLYHDVYQTKLISIIFKFMNRKGFVYVKMDADEKYLLTHEKNSRSGYYLKRCGRQLLQYFFERSVDLISFETNNSTSIYKQFHSNIERKLITVPNGLDIELYDKMESQVQRKDIMLTVGRIGVPQKNHKMLIEALKKIDDLKKWQVHLIGPVEPEFEKWLSGEIKNTPSLKNNVHLIGEIISKAKLISMYQEAKIFLLTSDYEGYPLVFPEALYCGNFIISTDVSGACEATKNGRFGRTVPVGDVDALSTAIAQSIANPNILEPAARDGKNYTRENFNWQNLIAPIYGAFGQHLSE